VFLIIAAKVQRFHELSKKSIKNLDFSFLCFIFAANNLIFDT